MMRASFDAEIFAVQQAGFVPRDLLSQSSSAMSFTVLRQFWSSNQIVAKIFLKSND
jgi:hypothetical protein